MIPLRIPVSRFRPPWIVHILDAGMIWYLSENVSLIAPVAQTNPCERIGTR